MMTSRTIITRSRRAEAQAGGEFNFTREMVPYLSDGREVPEFLADYHERAWKLYEEMPLPTPSDEAWRRTDLRSLPAGVFRLSSAEPADEQSKPPAEYLESLVDSEHGGEIVITPGNIQTTLSEDLAARGVVFVDLTTAERKHADLLAMFMGQVVRPDEGKFAAMASALARSGVLIYIPRGVQVEQPLHSIMWGSGSNQAIFSHVLVWVDDGASLTYVHESASPNRSDTSAFHAGVVEIQVGAGAGLRFVELQSWGQNVWNFSHERARVHADGSLDWVFGAIGSRLTKNFSELDLVGQGASGRMSGFYFTEGEQHLDHDTQQNHRAPHTTSDLLFKGALKGKSRSVWQGMVYVAPGAQKTDGYQANRNLVLSPNARADSIPGLEILADDVRCTHGATVGKVDPEQVFYLLSRGIPYPDAERLIVEGFFDPIMQRIPFEGVRSRFQKAIQKKME